MLFRSEVSTGSSTDDCSRYFTIFEYSQNFNFYQVNIISLATQAMSLIHDEFLLRIGKDKTFNVIQSNFNSRLFFIGTYSWWLLAMHLLRIDTFHICKRKLANIYVNVLTYFFLILHNLNIFQPQVGSADLYLHICMVDSCGHHTLGKLSSQQTMLAFKTFENVKCDKNILGILSMIFVQI